MECKGIGGQSDYYKGLEEDPQTQTHRVRRDSKNSPEEAEESSPKMAQVKKS